jgi:hypothetical protein
LSAQVNPPLLVKRFIYPLWKLQSIRDWHCPSRPASSLFHLYTVFIPHRLVFSMHLSSGKICRFPALTRSFRRTEMDLIYIAGIAVFWGVCLALTIGCEKLHRRASGGRP